MEIEQREEIAENTKIKKIILFSFGAVLVFSFLLSLGIYVFSRRSAPLENPVGGEVVNVVKRENKVIGVKEFPSPINGVLYTKEEYEKFKDRRPLAVMVNNHVQARPQFGLSKADIVYEAVAEGGITRLMPIFHSQDAEKVGSVRSARVHFIDIAAEYYAWYAHWGGAYAPTLPDGTKDYSVTNPKADSYQHINDVGIASLDQNWLGSSAYYRDNSRGVALEHTGYTSTVALWREGPKRYPEEGWTKFYKFDTWKFKDDAIPTERGSVKEFTFNFWDNPDFEVTWRYDREKNSYVRYQGGNKQIDALTNEELRAKNVIVQFVKETPANDKKNHLLYDIVGSGVAKVFRDGKVINATWKKPSIRGRTKYFDELGSEVVFNRGQIWVEIVPSYNMDSLSLVVE